MLVAGDLALDVLALDTLGGRGRGGDGGHHVLQHVSMKMEWKSKNETLFRA